MATQLAIEYGRHKARLVEFEGSGRKLRVLDVVEVDLDVAAAPDEEFEADDLRAEALARSVKEARLTTDPSAMSFPAGLSLFREFDLPFTADDQIEKVVRFEAESHIPLDIDEVVMQHVVLRKTREKSHLLAAVVKKDDLLDRFDILDEANIDPMVVDLDVFALYNALSELGIAEENPDAVVVNAQQTTTTLLFLAEGELVAVRTLRMGSHGIHVDDPTTDSDALPSEDDEFVLVDDRDEALAGPGMADAPLDDDIEIARAHDFLSRLGREIRRTRAALPTVEVGKVLVTGLGSRVPGFEEAMGEAFSAPVEGIDFLDSVDHKLGDDDARHYGPDLGVVLGLAFKLNGRDALGLDFRRGECAYTRKFDQVKTPLIVMAFLLFLLVALKAIDSTFLYKRVHSDYDQLLANAKVQLQVLLNDNDEAEAVWSPHPFGPAQVEAIHRRVDGLYEDYARQLGRGERIPEQESALQVWLEFSRLVAEHEESLGRFFVKKLDISVTARTPVLKVSGVMESSSHYQRLLNLLGESELFEDVEFGGTRPTDDGMTSFSETLAHINMAELARLREAASGRA